MARRSRTGVRGLYREADGRSYIDLRWRDSTGKRQRYTERLPLGTKAAAAKYRAQQVLNAAIDGSLASRKYHAGRKTLKDALALFRAMIDGRVTAAKWGSVAQVVLRE